MFAMIHHRLEQISRFAVWVGGAALMAAAFMVTVDVLFRKFVGITMSGSDEYSGYVFAASTTWAYSYCLLHRSNVRIDARDACASRVGIGIPTYVALLRRRDVGRSLHGATVLIPGTS